jgi:pimeloyl-ACP methyl ester carboxylesterase
MEDKSKKDGVIVLHGIFRTKYSMRILANFLEKSGFNVLNIGYPSTRYSIENLADIIKEEIELFSKDISGKLHFVGYSMGGLLIRSYLKKYRPKNLGRVVMIGTPNKGSEVADFLKNFFLYKMLYGPAGQQLITMQENFSKIYAPIDFELGIISGNKPLLPLSSLLIRTPHDGLVSIESSKIDEAKDHIIIPSNHTLFPYNKEMCKQVVYFLNIGKFNHNH